MGGYTCDLNTYECRELPPAGVYVTVTPRGDGTFLLQFASGTSVTVRSDCSLVDQPQYNVHLCPFFPNVSSYQGILFSPDGTTFAVPDIYQYVLVDEDFDGDGVLYEPGYAGTKDVVAYREDGTLKYWAYVVGIEQQWSYLILFQAQ